MSHLPNCMVYLDAEPRIVPWKPCCNSCARGYLGIDRGVGVARELGETGNRDGEALTLEAHEFREGERYVTVGIEASVDFVDDEDEPRQPWQQDPNGWKG